MKRIMHIEVAQKSVSNANSDTIEAYVRQLAKKHGGFSSLSKRTVEFTGDPFLEQHVQMITTHFTDGDCDSPGDEMHDAEMELDPQVYVFRLNEDGPQLEEMGEDESVSAATHWILPSRDLHGLWDSLVYDTNVKNELLNFASSALLFSDRGVSEYVVGLNRVVLLHGPPGTGKTSLCRALAQKLAVRFSARFSYGQLIEINSHSLFSKWFSESGKLVMRMFSRIHEMVEDSKAIVCVLIDEVESLAHARSSAQGGTEPSDSLRAVNALLTQIDAIRRYPNVIILTTSNITQAIDLAFVDRADIKKYIGLPTAKALYRIYYSCLTELMRTEIIYPKEKLWKLQRFLQREKVNDQETPNSSTFLMSIAQKSEGLSGRSARKIPFLAHANFIQRPHCSLPEFLEAMDKAVDQELDSRKLIDEIKK